MVSYFALFMGRNRSTACSRCAKVMRSDKLHKHSLVCTGVVNDTIVRKCSRCNALLDVFNVGNHYSQCRPRARRSWEIERILRECRKYCGTSTSSDLEDLFVSLRTAAHQCARFCAASERLLGAIRLLSTADNIRRLLFLRSVTSHDELLARALMFCSLHPAYSFTSLLAHDEPWQRVFQLDDTFSWRFLYLSDLCCTTSMLCLLHYSTPSPHTRYILLLGCPEGQHYTAAQIQEVYSGILRDTTSKAASFAFPQPFYLLVLSQHSSVLADLTVPYLLVN